MFKDVWQIKMVGERFPPGRIVPQRVLKGPRKQKHLVVFGAECWAFRTRDRVILTADLRNDGAYAIRIKNGVKNATFQGAPYSGELRMISNYGKSDEEWVAAVARELAI